MSSEDDKGLIIFGRDVSKIPCFRNSFLYGISGGLGAGLLCFLFTSRATRAADVGVATWVLVTMSYWIHCRYQYSKTKFEMLRMQELLRHHVQFEGTDVEQKIEPGVENEPVSV